MGPSNPNPKPKPKPKPKPNPNPNPKLAQNGVTTASVLCAPSARFCGGLLRKLSGAAAGARGAAEGARGADRYEALLVDPPRAGLDQTTLSLVQKFDQVLYISCNPATLRENLRASGLEHTHVVRKFALFDHFPYTPHLECGVWLARRCKE